MGAHIRRAHGFKCGRCNQRFGSEKQLQQHLHDAHGLDKPSAQRDSRNHKIDQWMDSKHTSAAKSACEVDADLTVASAPPMYSHKCELCSAVAQLPVDIASQGLTFQCSHIGRTCVLPGDEQLFSERRLLTAN